MHDLFRAWLDWLIDARYHAIAVYTRKCDGQCDSDAPHTHHLNRLGQWRYR